MFKDRIQTHVCLLNFSLFYHMRPLGEMTKQLSDDDEAYRNHGIIW